METALVAILGLITGSFLNVVILRLHAGKDYIRGRSACPSCGHKLSALELVPVLSWLSQRGRCRHCGRPVSIQYPLVEAATAVLFVLAYISQPHVSAAEWAALWIWFYVIGSLIVLAVYDLRWYLLPDKVLLPLIPAAVVMIAAQAAGAGSLTSAARPLEAAVLFGGGFYAIAAVSAGKWMGGGDIKLAFVMGLLLGLQKTALAMFIAFCAAALAGGLLILARRKSRKDLIPFGPFLIAGTLISYLYGTSIIGWYLNVSGLNLL